MIWNGVDDYISEKAFELLYASVRYSSSMRGILCFSAPNVAKIKSGYVTVPNKNESAAVT